MDEPPHAGLARGAGQVAAAHRIDAVEDPIVGEPLLGQAHGVEDELAAGDGRRQAGRVGGVALRDLDVGGKHRGGALGIADEDAHVVPALEQHRGEGVADLARGAGDQDFHEADPMPGPGDGLRARPGVALD